MNNQQDIAQIESNITRFFKLPVGAATYEDVVVLGGTINDLLALYHKQANQIKALTKTIEQSANRPENLK